MNRVAITGLGVISPVGQDIETVFANLRDGVCGVGRITRFDPSETKISVAAEVKDFDPEAFGISRGDTRRMDLFTQYAMAAAQQAVDDSGIVGAVAPERLGVYVGSGIGGMNTFMAECKKLFDRGPSRISPLFIPMMIGNIAAGNIAIRYGCKGPSLPVVTACATSTNTIGEAFHAIRYGYADAILAGGSEATVNALAIGGFANCKALTEATDPEAASQSVPTLFMVEKGVGASFMTPLISLLIILGAVSTAVNMVAAMVKRVCGERSVQAATGQRPQLRVSKKEAATALICCAMDFGIAQFGLLNLIQRAYSAIAYLAIPVILIPYLIHMIVTRFDTKSVGQRAEIPADH